MDSHGTDRRARLARATLAVLVLMLPALSAAQERYEDVVRNLRNPDPAARLAAVRLLREARHVEAIVPLAPLVNDPVDAIQLEALGAELSFFLVEDIPARRRVGFLVEVRNRGAAATAFERGRLAVWPRAAPPELVTALLQALDDENARVRVEAVYTLGVTARAPLAADASAALVRALDHYDPAVRAGAARVAGRLGVASAADALIKGINDSQAAVRYASMTALGMLRHEQAVVALTEQLEYYGRGDGAAAALDALARIAHPSSVPLFTSHLTHRDAALRRAAAEGLGRAGHATAAGVLETAASTDPDAEVRAAMLYALQKQGRNYVVRLIEFLDEDRTALQVQEYFFDLGAAVEPHLLPSLREPDEDLRAAVVEVLGEIGTDASVAALQKLQDTDRTVVEAARRALERIRLRRAL